MHKPFERVNTREGGLSPESERARSREHPERYLPPSTGNTKRHPETEVSVLRELTLAEVERTLGEKQKLCEDSYINDR